mgnify:CR=1 FL=1
MKMLNLQNYLDRFANTVVKQSQDILKKDKGNTTLGQSIRATVTEDDNGFSVKFFMLDYGTFLDKGIKPKGTGRGRSKNTGQYISGLAYLISKKIKRDGIKSISFFTTPLTIQYNKLQDDFLKVFTEDIRTYITTFTKNK